MTVHRRGSGHLLVILLALSWASFPVSARADFDLPILFPVQKTISVPEGMSHDLLLRFAQVKDLTMEIRMVHGNMVRDNLVKLLNKQLGSVKKNFVLAGALKQVHVDQLRRVKNFEISYRIEKDQLDRVTSNSLFALGPIRKYLHIRGKIGKAQLKSISKLRFSIPCFQMDLTGDFDEDLLHWLSRRRGHGTRFFIGAESKPEAIYKLLQFKPVMLVVETQRNRIPQRLLAVLKDLRGVEIMVVVDGRLTKQDVQEICKLERFSLKIVLEGGESLTPGLLSLLNRVAPPLRK